MDLKESRLYTGEDADSRARHPWEISRLTFVKQLLENSQFRDQEVDVLDVGCGDGFVARQLIRHPWVRRIAAVDPALPKPSAATSDRRDSGIQFYKRVDDIGEQKFHVILLLDVLEHVEDDSSFMHTLTSNYLRENGMVIVTVPAFPLLFSSHDRFLAHYRRYTATALESLVRKSGLALVSCGYLYFTLLILRSFQIFMEKKFHKRVREGEGIEKWKRGRLATSILAKMLAVENGILKWLTGLNIRIPGLSVWALCAK